MSKSDNFEGVVLDKVFFATEFPWDAATDFDLHLHSADPGEGSASTVNELSYTGYSPVTVSRSISAWTRTGDTVTNDNLIQFGECTAGSGTATHFSITPDGSTTIIYIGELDASRSITAGNTPQFAPGEITFVEG